MEAALLFFRSGDKEQTDSGKDVTVNNRAEQALGQSGQDWNPSP